MFFDKDKGFFEYEVRFNPELDAKNRRIKAVNTIIREMGSVKVFDGGSVLYLPQKISGNVMTYNANILGPDGDEQVAVTLIFKRQKDIADRECLHLYNVLFKRIMHILLYTQMKRSYVNLDHRYLIPQHKLEVNMLNFLLFTEWCCTFFNLNVRKHVGCFTLIFQPVIFRPSSRGASKF